ncbi:MAG: hypothetical protein KC729_00050 [Candidatus Eisenbacteria bacterium]|uniref:Uncharacterized protein n=1 Tax=Eiseniibacteriota bacterium TaxID=2212470 RepID=A0A956RM44_UNCEI|nr:hypothetical protein [Candidatus Eisenbacteria bacterium]
MMLAADTWTPNLRLVTLATEKVPTGELMESTAYASALRLGLILSGQMAGYIAWTASKEFTPLTLHKVPREVEMQDELTDEWVRFTIGAYIDGVFSTSRPGYSPYASLSPRALERFEIQAANLADAAVHHVRTLIMPVLESAFDAQGKRVKPHELIEREIRSVYSQILDAAPRADVAKILTLARPNPVDKERDKIVRDAQRRARGRRMRVRDKERRDQFLRDHKPFSKWIKQSVEQILAEAKAPPTISPKYAIRWVQTDRTRFMADGVLAATENDPDVIGWRFVAADTTKNHHEACAAMNGKIISKRNAEAKNTWKSPLHHGCNSRWIPVYRWEHERVTPKRQLPSPSLIAPGFGAQYADRAKTRRIEVKPRRVA